MGSGVAGRGDPICGDPGELGRQVPSMHRRNEQRITGPMLFRLLRAAIPQRRSRSICGEQMRGLSDRQRLQRQVLDTSTIRSNLRGGWSSRCDTPAMGAGPIAVIAYAEEPSLASSLPQVLTCTPRPAQRSIPEPSSSLTNLVSRSYADFK